VPIPPRSSSLILLNPPRTPLDPPHRSSSILLDPP
jgi:hypothetical protein